MKARASIFTESDSITLYTFIFNAMCMFLFDKFPLLSYFDLWQTFWQCVISNLKNGRHSGLPDP